MPGRRASDRTSVAGRVGLALAGGGPAGAVYEIGALCALQDALEGVDFTQLACYVGVSAGSVVAASLANGLTPARLARLMVASEPSEPGEPPFDPEIFFRPNYREIAWRSARLPVLVAEALWELARRRRGVTAVGALSRIVRALPGALFENEPIRRYFHAQFTHDGRTDDFRRLKRHLIIVATDLGSGQSIRFGDKPWDHVPISTAIQASTAVPGLYPPVMIDGRACVDGVLLKTVHASVALDRGVGLLLCVNPIVPVDTTSGERHGALRQGELYEHGVSAVLSQTFRTLVHSRFETGIAGYRDRYPQADVVLLEPRRDEYGMFFANIFSFASRSAICELAYRATRDDLRLRADALEPMFARHGLRLRRELLEDADWDLWHSLEMEESRVERPKRRLRAAAAR